jgi:hypothetical protein
VSARGSRPWPAARPAIRAQRRSAATARVGRSSLSGRTIASGCSGEASRNQRRSSPPPSRMITCRPSGPRRSVRAPPSCARSSGRAPEERSGAGWSKTIVGSISGRQNTATWSAASLGSTGKAQPPTPGEGIPCHAPGTGVGGGPSHYRFVVFLIGRVTTQEFPRKTRPIEALQVVISSQRPPIRGWWHHWSPKMRYTQRMSVGPERQIHVQRRRRGVARRALRDAEWASQQKHRLGVLWIRPQSFL